MRKCFRRMNAENGAYQAGSGKEITHGTESVDHNAKHQQPEHYSIVLLSGRHPVSLTRHAHFLLHSIVICTDAALHRLALLLVALLGSSHRLVEPAEEVHKVYTVDKAELLNGQLVVDRRGSLLENRRQCRVFKHKTLYLGFRVKISHNRRVYTAKLVFLIPSCKKYVAKNTTFCSAQHLFMRCFLFPRDNRSTFAVKFG